MANDLHTTHKNVRIPVSFSTYCVKDHTELNSVLTVSGDQWILADDYVVNLQLLSLDSAVRLEFKINYVASPEAGQLITFRVTRDEHTDGSSSDISNLVFQDATLGTLMGVTSHGVYNGVFIDKPNKNRYRSDGEHVDISHNVSYYLQFFINKGTRDNNLALLDISSGIMGYNASEKRGDFNNYNFISAQELYIPYNYSSGNNDMDKIPHILYDQPPTLNLNLDNSV